MKAAIYARYSTDQQREASIEDQFRECEKLAERNSFTVIARFSDRAISGGTAARPGYQALLDGARRGSFDVILAEDVSRLWRNMAEQGPRLAELHDLGVAVVTHDLDTRQENAGLLGAVMGASSEAYRKEIGRRSRRGLEGRARAGAPSGSRAYGYIPAAQSGTGQIEVDPTEAAVVREIFERYANGWSPQRIAADLNRRGVPSPAAKTRRLAVRGWSASTIAGAARAGSGILNIDSYRGVKVWGRTARIRSAADSRRRKCVVRPERDWIVTPAEHLRIVDDALWQAVKRRQAQQTQAIGARVSAGLTRAQARATGKRPQYLFSGLLRCEECGSRLVMGDRRAYACAGSLYDRGCTNRMRVRRDRVESRLLDSVRDLVRDPEVFREIRVRVVRLYNSRKAPASPAPRIRELQVEVENLTDAIARGMLRASPALAERLRRAEDELATLRAAEAPAVFQLPDLERLQSRYQRLVGELDRTLGEDIPRARTALQAIVGDSIPVRRAADGTHLEALVGLGIEQEALAISDAPRNLVPRARHRIYRQVVPLK